MKVTIAFLSDLIPIKLHCLRQGFPISLILNEIYYDENDILLNKGDRILFYTDGITEVKNIDGDEFGVERVVDVIKMGRNSVIRWNNQGSGKIQNGGEQEDDLCYGSYGRSLVNISTSGIIKCFSI